MGLVPHLVTTLGGLLCTTNDTYSQVLRQSNAATNKGLFRRDIHTSPFAGATRTHRLLQARPHRRTNKDITIAFAGVPHTRHTSPLQALTHAHTTHAFCRRSRQPTFHTHVHTHETHTRGRVVGRVPKTRPHTTTPTDQDNRSQTPAVNASL